MDEFTEVTTEGWGGRLMDSIKGIVVGLALFIGAFPLTWWNEGRAVTQTRSLEEGAGALVQGDAARLDSGNEGRLVHVAGNVEATSPIVDEQFGISADVLGLKRTVEMYQWREHETKEKHKKLGGGTETVTTYSYELDWADGLVDSNRFRHTTGHENPHSMPVASQRVDAGSAKLGAYTLDQQILRKLSHWQPLAPAASAAAVPGYTLVGNTWYSGSDPNNPKIGDVRVHFDQIAPGPYSFVARQSGNGLGEYPTKAGNPILLIEQGTVPAQLMFQKAHSANNALTWILRIVGFALMTFGMSFVLRPLSTVLDVVPFLGNVAEMGILVVCALLSAVFTSITIALAWLWYRPLIGVAMLVAAAGAIFLLRQRKSATPARAPMVPPPPPMAVPPPPPAG